MDGNGFSGTLDSLEKGLSARVRLNDSHAMPWLGLGVFQIANDADAAAVIRQAVALGYRSIDTAAIYGNERGVGEGLRTCGVTREEIFLTTKLWNQDMRADRQAAAFDESLDRLGVDYVDLYLLHWPIDGKRTASWQALEKIRADGRAHSIGVSNFMIPHLEELRAASGVVPAVNQIEYHPYLQSPALVDYCREHGIRIEAWSPLMRAGAIMRDPVLTEIAHRQGKSVAQVILRWDLQTGVVTIPKSVRDARLLENANVFDFELTATEVRAIAALDRGERSGPDPMSFDF